MLRPEIPDFPRRVQIQTTPACGAACTICPHAVESPKWSNGLMSDELFASIVDQLRGREIDYISPYLMADPLSDKKIYPRIAALREACPDATIEVSTTGKYLFPPMREKLLKTPLTELRISSHGLTAEEWARTMPGVPHERSMGFIDDFIEEWKAARPYPLSIVCLFGLWPREREAEIEAHWRERGVELSTWRVISRADQVDLTVFGDGSADPTDWQKGIEGGSPFMCRHNRDTEWLHVLSDGRVVLCCMDYKQEEIVGDLREQTIEEVWHGPEMQRVRAIIAGDIPPPPSFICSRCEWYVSQKLHTQITLGATA